MQERPTIQNDARSFLQILNNQQLQRLVKDFHLDEEAKRRIRSLDYSNYHSFYHIKDIDRITMTPAKSLGKSICRADDVTIKWFLLLYSIASLNDIFEEKIYSHSDSRIIKHWYRRGDSLSYVDSDYIDSILDNVLDIDAYFPNNAQFGPQMRYWDSFRRAIILFCLSAGHHWENRISYIPNELLNRDYGMPLILSTAFFISVITGKDFYEALKETLKLERHEGMLDDVITMVKAETEKRSLISQKEELLRKLSVCEEEIRKKETALDITVASFGKGLTEEDLGFMINHCNQESFRTILYEAENILGERLAVTDKLPDKEKKEFLASKLSEEYNIILSEGEILSVSTYEELIDVIQTHCSFLDSFMAAIYLGETFDDILGNELYDIQTKISEIRKRFGEDLDTSNVHNTEELKNVVTQKHPTLNFKDYLVDKLGVDPSEITPNANLVNDIGADSLDIVEICMHIEKTLNIEILDEEWGEVQTIGDAYNLIKRKVLGKTLH